MNQEPRDKTKSERSRDHEAAELLGCPSCETLHLLVSQPSRAGLEQRIMTRLRAEAERKPVLWWAVCAGLASTAAVALLAGVAIFQASAHRPAPGASAPGFAAQAAGAHAPASPSQPLARSAGSFGTAGSMRVPPSLKPLYVPAPPHRASAATDRGMARRAKKSASEVKHASTKSKVQPESKTQP